MTTAATRISSADRICCVAGCGQPYKAKGLCQNHYQQEWQRRRKGQPPQRFERIEPAIAICPDHLLPLVAQLVDLDAARLFRIAWWWCGEQALAKQRGAA